MEQKAKLLKLIFKDYIFIQNWLVTFGGMFLLPISKHCPVKLYESLLDAETLKYPLSRQ